MPPSHYSNESLDDFLLLLHTFGPRILAAIICGGLIGAENQIYGKSAGLRTSLLMTIACCVITIASIEIGALYNGSPDRITAQIITGVGFVGGGVILQQRGKIHGITTAASIFVCAGIGIVAGAGYIYSAVAIALLATSVLLLLRPLDYFIDKYPPFLQLREMDRRRSIARKKQATKTKQLVDALHPKDSP